MAFFEICDIDEDANNDGVGWIGDSDNDLMKFVMVTRVRRDPGTRPATRPELFFKYPTCPDPKIENDWVPGN